MPSPEERRGEEERRGKCVSSLVLAPWFFPSSFGCQVNSPRNQIAKKPVRTQASIALQRGTARSQKKAKTDATRKEGSMTEYQPQNRF